MEFLPFLGNRLDFPFPAADIRQDLFQLLPDVLVLLHLFIHIEGTKVVVHHLNGMGIVGMDALPIGKCTRPFAGGSSVFPIRQYHIKVIRFHLRPLQKAPDNSRQLPGIYRRDNANGIILVR